MNKPLPNAAYREGRCARCGNWGELITHICRSCNEKRKCEIKEPCDGKLRNNRNNIFSFGKAREEVKRRDGNRCAECRSDKLLDVHHLNMNRRDNRLENLITLCAVCHSKKHKCYSLNKRKRF